MAETLFPVRRRCKKCGKGLGLRAQDPVYLGLYCSPKCAGIANPPTDPANAPRECTTMRDGKVVFKRKFRSDSEIPDKIKQDPSSSFYWCSSCGHRHSGHTRIGTPEQFRMLREKDDIRDILIKRRGNATIAQVAAAAGVRPIRVKELEEGIKHIDYRGYALGCLQGVGY